MKPHNGVLGPNTTTDEQNRLGREVGRALAKADAMLFCGFLRKPDPAALPANAFTKPD